MAESMKLDILTPLGPRRSGIEVPGIEVPGVHGELGLLPHHEALVTAVVPGVLRFREGTQTTRVAVGSGFLEVKDGGRVVILVERTAEAKEVDVPTVETRLSEVERAIAAYDGPRTDAKVEALLTEAEWLRAQLRITR